jgi:hypothetical protein
MLHQLELDKSKEENNISNSEWEQIHQDDLWVYNKLQLSKKLGYLCGPCGVDVPIPNYYIVRPAINFNGMGRFSRIEWLELSTDHLHPSEFWCEIFTGDHISIDFYNKTSKLVVKGFKNPKNPSYMWNSWVKINKNVEFPEILNNLVGNYPVINCEFIGNNLIEVQFRENLDFRWGNTIAIPVWKDKSIKILSGFKFVKDKDYNRKGFLIK